MIKYIKQMRNVIFMQPVKEYSPIKEFLLEELKEHTSDCDFARAQHFYEEKQ